MTSHRLEAVLRAGEAYRRSTCTGGTLADDIRNYHEDEPYDELGYVKDKEEALATKLNNVGRARLSKEVRQKPALFGLVDEERPDYAELARMVVQQNPEDLAYVSYTHVVYSELARMLVQSNPYHLRFVDENCPDYVAISKLAVQKDGLVLKFVGRYRDTDMETTLGWEADELESWRPMSNWKGSIHYGEIAKLAVEEDADALEYVYRLWLSAEQYKALALMAVRKDPDALKHVHPSIDDDPEVLDAATKRQTMLVRLPAVPSRQPLL